MAESITVTPSPAWPGANVVVRGTGFAKNQKVSVTINGVSVGTVGTGGKGVFGISTFLSNATGTVPVVALQYARKERSWSEVADVDLVVTALPEDPPEDPPADPDGWVEKFFDDFDTWAPSNYFVYPATWLDTSRVGRYDPTAISATDSKLRIRLRTVSGQPRVCALVPLLPGSATGRGDWLGMRVSFLIRADLMPRYKGVPLLWPKEGNPWPLWGEINWPEGEFDKRPAAFMHRQNATASNDQDYYNSPLGTNWQDWHEYTIEWVAATSCKFYIDGVLIGASTARVPAGPMHLVLQFETNLSGLAVDPATDGFVEIDWLKIWVPA